MRCARNARRMDVRPDVFLDTSALVAGIWSDAGGARALLRLGEAGAIRLLVSGLVLAELERVIRRKAPTRLGLLALILDASRVTVVPSAPAETVAVCERTVTYPADAEVLAAAWATNAAYFVTLDRVHFLENEALRKLTPFPIGTPGDCLAWLRQGWMEV